jgi:hypothetical protein
MFKEQWSEAERWVWKETRAGRIADFNAREERQDGPLNPTTSQGWDETRKIRSVFLKKILAEGPYRGEIPAEGVRIVGAWLTEAFELEFGQLVRQLWLDHCRFERPAKLQGIQIEGLLSFEGSAFAAQGTEAASLDMKIAKIGGQLNLHGVMVAGRLNLNGAAVGQHLLMGQGASFQDVDLVAAKIGAQLNMGLRKDSEKECGATFSGLLILDYLEVGGDVVLRDTRCKKLVSLIFAHLRGSLDLSGSELTQLDCSGTRIEGELSLGSAQHSKTTWREHAGLNLDLRNLHVGALQDRMDRIAEQPVKRPWWIGDRDQWEDAWPAKMELDGFTYDRLGGYGGTTEGNTDLDCNYDVDMQARDVRWYLKWLARDHSYSPQPYEQLARTFRATGHPSKANCILYISRRRARTEAWRQGEYLRWLGSCVLDWTIGYGLGGRYFLALLWVIAFAAIGTGVLYCSGQPSEGLGPGLPARFFYSLNQLLPIVEFEKYDNVELAGWVAYFFYFQKLIGWVLGSFLIAGLAGLTQKQ